MNASNKGIIKKGLLLAMALSLLASALAPLPAAAQSAAPAAVIGALPLKGRQISLIFEGISDEATMAAISGLLNERGVHAAFFLPAIQVAETPQIAAGLAADGQALGNYMLKGEKRVEELSPEKQSLGIRRSQEVLTEASGSTPYLFRGNLSKYDSGLLARLGENGIRYALEPSVFLNHVSFISAGQAGGFAAKTPSGSLVSIKIDQALEQEEMAREDKPTDKPEPKVDTGPKEGGQRADTRPAEERLLEVVAWVLDAYQAEGFTFLSPEEMYRLQDSDYTRAMQAALNETQSAALEKALDESSPQAVVLSSAPIAEKEFSLVIEGIGRKEFMDRLLAALNRHGVKAAFFLPAAGAAAQPETFKAIAEGGHALGNYMFDGEKQAEKLGRLQQVTSLYRAQQLLTAFSGHSPTLLRANNASYSPSLLQAARAVGLEYALSPTRYINHQSFTSLSQAQGYAAGLPAGTLLSVKVGQALTDAEAGREGAPLPEPSKSPAPPTPTADGNDPHLTPTPPPAKAESADSWEERLLSNLDWLLQALSGQGMAAVSPEALLARQGGAYSRLIREINAEAVSAGIPASLGENSPGAQVVPLVVPIADMRLSLAFEGTPDLAALDGVLAELRRTGVKAGFFIPSDALAREPRLASRILAEGHQLGNYLMEGEKRAESLSEETLAASLYRASQVIKGLTGAAPVLLRGNLSQYTGRVLQIAKAVGLDYALAPTRYINHQSFSAPQQAEAYAHRLLPGDLVSIKINQALEREEFELGAAPQPTPYPALTPAAEASLPPEQSQIQQAEARGESWQTRLIQVTGWFLDAAKGEGYRFVDAQGLAPVAPGSGSGGGSAPGSREAGEAAAQVPTRVLSGQSIPGQAISLIIEGSPDAASTEIILNLLARTGAQATFFIPGEFVKNNPGVAESILEAGHSLGNYLMRGESRVETLDSGTAFKSLVAAGEALAQAGAKPDMFKGSVTQLTPELLDLLSRAGLAYAVQPDRYLNHTSFRTPEQAEGYARRTAPGTIVDFKLGLPIDASELPQPTPAATANPGPAEGTPSAQPAATTPAPEQASPAPSASPLERALQVLGWLLEGYEKQGTRVISLKQLQSSQASPYSDLVSGLFSEQSTKEYREALNTSRGQADIYSSRPVFSREISLVFENFADEATMNALLDLLDKYQVKAGFYIPADKLVSQPEIARRITREGHALGNYGFSGERSLDGQPQDAIMASVWRAQAALTLLGGSSPEYFKGNLSEYSPALLTALRAAGIKAAIQPTAFVNHSSFLTEQQADNFARDTGWGTILGVKINQVIDPFDLQAAGEPGALPGPSPSAGTVPDGTPRPSAASAAPASPIAMKNEDRLLLVVDWLLKAYTSRQFAFVNPQAVQDGWVREISLLQQRTLTPGGTRAELMTNARTTQKKVSLLFSHIPDARTLEELMSTLRELRITGNLAVTADEVVTYREQLQQWLAAGHAVYSRGFTGASVSRYTYAETFVDIRKGQMLLEQELGLKPLIYAPLLGQSGEGVLMAAHDAGVVPVTYNLRARVNRGDSIEDVMKPFQWGIKRGDIIYIALADDPLIKKAISGIAGIVRGATYDFVTIDELRQKQYELKALEDIPGWDAVSVNPDYDPRASTQKWRYSRMPSRSNMLFLTFDDWGTDASTTRILDVLDEYGVKATFFVVASRAQSNPNLLRAISEAGHSIGSHSYEHILITDLTPQALQEDSVKAYRALAEIIGKAPDLIYRPPQLKSDRASVNAILAAGYKAIIQSNLSTHDYERTAQQVVDFLRYRVNRGGIIVLHVTPQASAGEALPRIIENARKAGYEFGRVIDYLPDAK